MQFADRIKPLQQNVFADIDRAKARVKQSGLPIIDLSLGSSDLPTSPDILNTIANSLQDPSTHGYLLFNGTQDFPQAAAKWYEKKFRIAIDPETEVLPLIGSQEGTAHLPLAILNPGDYALLLDPGYPSHSGGVHLAGGHIHAMPITAETNFLPVFQDIPSDILNRSRMMVLSYPHNPTSAIAPLSFFQDAVQFCQNHNLVLVHDFPYVDLVFTNDLVPSVFQADINKSCSIELFTLSKSYNMGGFRMYIWAKLPDRVNEYYSQQSMKFCIDLMEATGVIASPGIGFGAAGEGYIRFALVCEVEILKIAIDRIGQFIDKMIK